MRKQLGIEGPVNVELEFVISEQPLLDLIIPPELQTALEADKNAANSFRSLPPSHQKEIIFYVDEAKSSAARMRRVQKSLAILQRNRHLY
jgi:uncharacterized protein YdeI (YjbR/CyaY-like superfamily)